MTEDNGVLDYKPNAPPEYADRTGTIVVNLICMLVTAGLLVAHLTVAGPSLRATVALQFLFAGLALIFNAGAILLLRNKWQPGRFGFHMVLNFQCIFLFLTVAAIGRSVIGSLK